MEVCEVGLILFQQKCTNIELTMIYINTRKLSAVTFIVSYKHNFNEGELILALKFVKYID